MYRYLDIDEDTADMNSDNRLFPSTHIHFNPAVKPRSRLGRRRLPLSNNDKSENGASSQTPMQPPAGRVWSRDDSGISTGNDTTPSSRLHVFGDGLPAWKNLRHQTNLRQQDCKTITPSSNLLTPSANRPNGKFAYPSTPFRFSKNEPLKEITDVVNNCAEVDLKGAEGNQSTSSSQLSMDSKEAANAQTVQKQLNTSFCRENSPPILNVSESLSQSITANKTSNDTFKSDETSFMTAHDIQRPDFLTNRTFYDPEFLKTPGKNLAEIRIDESPFNPLEGFPDQSEEFVMDQSETPIQRNANDVVKSNYNVSRREDINASVSNNQQQVPYSLSSEVTCKDKVPSWSEIPAATSHCVKSNCSKQLPFNKELQQVASDSADSSPMVLPSLKKREECRTKTQTHDSGQKHYLSDTTNVTYPQSSHNPVTLSNGFSSQFSQTPASKNAGADSTWSSRTTDTFPLKSLNLNSFAKRPDVAYSSKVALDKQPSTCAKDVFVTSVLEDHQEKQKVSEQTPKPGLVSLPPELPISSSCRSLNYSSAWTSEQNSFQNTPKVVHVNVIAQGSSQESMDDNSYTTKDYTIKAAPEKHSTNDHRPDMMSGSHTYPTGDDDVTTVEVAPTSLQVQDQRSVPASKLPTQVLQSQAQHILMNPSSAVALDCNSSSVPNVLKPQPQNVIRIKGVPYTVLSLLGKGGSSQVYQALGPQSSKLMAIKCVNLSQAEESMASDYLNEIALLSKLQGCPCVIKMFDSEYIPQSQMLYVVLEKGDIDFSKLVKNISETKQISMPMIIYYWTEMLNAVFEIHKRDIIHSDLKPANFLLVEGRLKLIDFGIASSIQGDTTSVMKEVPAGTYNYMSPESITGPKITRKSDVWSLGCILYNLLYGKTPFGHLNHRWQKLHAIVDPNHKVTFPKLSIQVPPSLRYALRWCLNKDPTARPTVEDLVKLSQLSPDINSPLGKEIDNMMITYFKRVIPDLKALKEEGDMN